MAQETKVILIDDIDGGPADETVRFAYAGTAYALELSTDNANKLRAALDQFIQAGRKDRLTDQRAVQGRKAGVPARPDVEQNKAKRDWLRRHGWEVSDRGRIAAHLEEAYENGESAPGFAESGVESGAPAVEFSA